MIEASPKLNTSKFITKLDLWVIRAMEILWIMSVFLVPLVFLGREFVISEAVIGYVELPKITLLRILTGLLSILWLMEWGCSGNCSSVTALSISNLVAQARNKFSDAVSWRKGHPGRWLILAVWFFLGSTLLSTICSGSFYVSLWGEVPGQDGYPFYTIASYILLFGVISTHLKTRAQLWRLLAAISAMGTLVAGYGIFQHYGIDFLNLTESTGGGVSRATSFMGNAIFSAAVMVMTIPVTFSLATIFLPEIESVSAMNRTKFSRWSLALTAFAGWGAILSIQVLGLVFTFSRGPWLGAIFALIVFLAAVALFIGLRSLGRPAFILVITAGFILGFLLWQDTLSIFGLGKWFGIIVGIASLVTGTIVYLNWRVLGKFSIAAGIAALTFSLLVLVLPGINSAVIPDSKEPFPNSEVPPSDSSEFSERFSSIESELSGGGVGGRTTHWKVSWELIKDRPWPEWDELSVRWLRPLIGYGPDLFRPTYLLKSLSEGRNHLPLEPDHAHNYFIHQAVEQGILGLISALGLFITVFGIGAHLLLKQRNYLSNTYKIVLIALLAIVAGRFLEMMVGVARVSDLTILWVILGIFAALPRLSHSQKELSSKVDVEPPTVVPRRGSRRRTPKQTIAALQGRFPWRLAIVVVLIGGISALTWQKNVNYLRASTVSANALKQFNDGNLESALASLDKATELAPDVTYYYNNRARVYLAYLLNENLPREKGCDSQDRIPYRPCLALNRFQNNLDGLAQRPLDYRHHWALANSVHGIPQFADEATRIYRETLSLIPNSWLVRNELAIAYAQAGQPNAALQTLNESLIITEGLPISSQAFFLQGLIYRGMKDAEKSTASMERSLQLGLGGESAQQAHDVLVEYYSSLSAETALRHLHGVIEANPKDPLAYYNRGQIFARLGDTDRAFDDFTKSVDLGFNWPGAFAWRGRMAQLLGRNDLAIDDLTKAVRLNPNNVEYTIYFSEFFLSAQNYQQAAHLLAQALKLDPDFARAHQLAGSLHHGLGLYKRAIQYFDHAIFLDPNLNNVYTSRSIAQREQELFDASDLATKEYETLSQSYSLDFSQAEYHAWTGRMYILLDRAEDAKLELARAVEMDPQNAEYHAYLGEALRSVGSYREAGLSLKLSLELDPEFAKAYYSQGLLYSDLDLYAQAIQYFDKAIALDTQITGLLDSRAEIQLEKELFDASDLATKEYETLSQSYSPDFSQPDYWAWTGRMYILLDRAEDATLELTRAVGVDPQNAEYHAYLGEAFRSVGRYPEAGQHLNQALLLDHRSGLTHYLIALLYSDLDLYAQAIQYFDKAIALDTQITGLPDSRAEIQLKKELFDASDLATKEYETLSQSYSLDFSQPDYWAWTGRMYILLDRAEDATLELTRAVGVDPQNAEYHAYLGEAFRAAGRYRAAGLSLKLSLELDPEFAKAYYSQGLLYSDLDLYAQAIQYFDKAIALDTQITGLLDSRAEIQLEKELFDASDLATKEYETLSQSYSPDFSQAEYHAWTGRMYILLDRAEDAKLELTRAVGVDPQNAEYHAYLGEALRSVGSYREAGLSLKLSLELNPGFQKAYYFQGILLYDQGQFLESVQNFDQAINMGLNAAGAYLGRAKSYLMLSLNEQAFQDLDQALALDPNLTEAQQLR
ncbi:tetratricopeptide repeat protein [SAR202 cluster bacterium AD-802-F09_MRT_200m]|nr:tetratricopeptide repeat protein [SAR202 cluster bacterium AD-802-F09_MRT_200m]